MAEGEQTEKRDFHEEVERSVRETFRNIEREEGALLAKTLSAFQERYLEAISSLRRPLVFDPFTGSSAMLQALWVSRHLPKEQIEKARTLAGFVFDDAAVAESWLAEPNLALENKAPVELLGTAEGFGTVCNLLMRIEHGVLA